MSHPHLLTLTLKNPDNVTKYEERTMCLIRAILGCSEKPMVESLDNFNRILESIITYDNTFTNDYVRDMIFFVGCLLYPSVAIFMLENGLYTKQTLTTFYLHFTPLHEAVKNCFILLIEHFGRIEYFGELLILGNAKTRPPIFFLSNSKLPMETILKSEYCTEETLKTQNNKSNVFNFYSECNYHNIVIALVESTKCTTECIVTSHKTHLYNNIMNQCCFQHILESNKLPIDFFVGHSGNFFGEVDNINLFLDSQYCTISIVENFINDCPFKSCNPNQYKKSLDAILIHPKYKHLNEKYDKNGSIKNDFEQNVLIDVINERFDEMNNIIKTLQYEIRILGLKIDKMELEKSTHTSK